MKREGEESERTETARGIILPTIEVDSSLIPAFRSESSLKTGKGKKRKHAVSASVMHSRPYKKRREQDDFWKDLAKASRPLVLTHGDGDSDRRDWDNGSTAASPRGSLTGIPSAETEDQFLRSSEQSKVARIRTFVEGFDEVLDGGVPEGHVVIVSGSPGTMKSTLTFYLLLNNALRANRKGLYVSLEESSGSLLRQMSSMGLALDKTGGNLDVLDAAGFRSIIKNSRQGWLKTMKSAVESEIEKRGYEILVIDSLGALEILAQFKNRRQDLFNLFQWFRELGLTTFVIAERPDIIIGGNIIMGRWDEEFLSDGIIQLRLHHSSDIEVQRRIRCVKMRSTRHQTNYLTILIDDGVLRATNALCP